MHRAAELREYQFIHSCSSLHSLSNSRKWAISCRASAENWPCFRRACLERARPAAVVGPVERPPCIRHRFLFRTAGQPHGVPLRVRAPQRGALLGFPGGLAFFSHPRRFAWGSFAVLLCIPTPHPPVDRSNNGLAASLHSDVLNGHLLLPAAAIRPQALRHRRKRP